MLVIASATAIGLSGYAIGYMDQPVQMHAPAWIGHGCQDANGDVILGDVYADATEDFPTPCKELERYGQ